MGYIRGFDGLRAISMLLVLITHLGWLRRLSEQPYGERVVRLMSGTTGVTIFFVLSGFLITGLLLREKVSKGHIALKNFYVRRFLRLLPPLLVLLLIVGVAMGVGRIRSSWVSWLLSFAYLQNFIPRSFYISELGHTWSLAVEEQFYVFWPLAIAFFRRRHVVTFALAITVVCVGVRICIPYFEFPYEGSKLFLQDMFFVDRWFIPAVGPIMMGSAAAVVHYFYRGTMQRYLEKSTWGLVGVVLLYSSPLWLPEGVLDGSYLVQSAGIVLLLLWICCYQKSALTNFLEWPPLAYIGRISYGLYVYHGFFVRTGPAPAGAPFFQQFPANLIFTLVVAVISYHVLEKPILALKSRFR